MSGSPTPTVQWFKNRKEFTLEATHRRRHNNLEFLALGSADEGTYACGVDTEMGIVMGADYTVNVLGNENTCRFYYPVCRR